MFSLPLAGPVTRFMGWVVDGLIVLLINVAAAVLLFPIALSTAVSLGVSVIPFAVCIMVAASASFATPIGCQTNLMVFGPGNYRFIDFLKMGLPLTILVGVLTVWLTPYIWPL